LKKNELKNLNLRAISLSLAFGGFGPKSNKEYQKITNNIFLKHKNISPDFVYNNFLKE